MTQPNRRNNGLWEYLKQSGVLDTGDQAAIKSAKQKYWKQYRREYKRNRRIQFPEVTVSMDRKTYDYLQNVAKKHHKTLSAFLRETTLHYLNQTFLIPNPGLVAQFAQRLRICASDINVIAKHMKKLKQYELYQAYHSLSERIQHLEEYISDTLRNPPRL